MSSSSDFKPLLGQSVGYGVVVGVGFFFAGIMLVLTFLQSRFSGISPSRAEEFSTASRNVKPGLVCCGIVSAWTWSATLLQSSTAAYTFGVSGPWWYGVGGTIQLAMFGMVAAKVKMNANGAHTFLEASMNAALTIVKARFGTGPHVLFTFYALLCVLIVSGSLLLGGAATVNALTGMNTDAACILLPIGIAVYVVFGGLRATFICDWSHTIILFIIIYLFLFKTYATSGALGSVSKMYDLLQQAAIVTPVEGNQNGSYLTMKSNQGLVFGAATILSGFSGVFCDQGYWQRAIASAPETTTKAYMLGGLSWFSVPWAFASCMGLAARALLTNPNFPTYPNVLSASQTSAGLAAPAAAATMMGTGGAVAVLLVVFMAVTSAASAELIAVSSIFTYDIYKTYFRPKALGRELVNVSHIVIGVWAIWMGCWAVILNRAGIDLGWLFYVQGVVLSPAVIPIGLTVCWSKLTEVAVLCGSIGGAVLGMLAWMVGCWKIYGSITILNLAEPYSAVCSGLTGLLFSGLITVGVTLISPDNYDFRGTRNIEIAKDDEDIFSQVREDPERASSPDEKKSVDGVDTQVIEVKQVYSDKDPAMRQQMETAFKRSLIYSTVLTTIVVIIGKHLTISKSQASGQTDISFFTVPFPMFFSHYVFSNGFYHFWVVCTFLWAFAAGTFSIVLPVWESRSEIVHISRGAFRYFFKSLRT
ncbi:Sodium:solute symporter family-domain-containing protein [Vararia minispora EC-137]|uniref:Sodium:solute symporter family-domain-containing protein n=1 Tax=Vararia minispora EC-137 TaxID=1314806 RepID=A0ACB8QB05_9AGAM|nr:Sodium:solute symporter family-domain-containing protein [Vararia minispora EC-137]